MRFLPLRLQPGVDLRTALEAMAASGEGMSAFVVTGIGSLSGARLRLAGADIETEVLGDVEILSLSGSISANGAHLHMAVTDAKGHVLGGHVCYGNNVRTTAELLLVQLSEWQLGREHDAHTGYEELVVKPAHVEPKNAP